MRVISALQGASGLVASHPVPKRTSLLSRIASELSRRFVEPSIIDHASGIYLAERPPFFAAARRDDV